MTRWLAVASALLAAACSSRTGRPHASVSQLRSLLATAGCWPSEAQSEAIFAETVATLRSTLHRPSSAVQEVDRFSRAVGASNLTLRAYPLGQRGVAVLSEIGCSGDAAAIQLSSLRLERGSWTLDAARRPEPPARYEIVAQSNRVPRIGVLEISTGTQAEHGTLEVLDERLRPIERHADLLDPLTTWHGDAAVIRWKERRRHLPTALDSPFLREIEAIVDVERTPTISAVSQAPWLDALDAVCAVRDDVPCGKITDVHGEPGRLTVDIEDTEPEMRCDVVPGAPTLGVAAVRSAAIGMVLGAGGWEVGAVRPGDRWCAVYGERSGTPLQLAPQVEKVANFDRPRALAVEGNRVLVATAEQISWLGRGADQPIWVDDPLDVTLIGGVPTWVDVGRRILRAPGRRGDVVVDAHGAAALASCDGALCWTDYDAGTVHRASPRGPTQVATGLTRPLGLAVGPGVLFVATDEGIVKVRMDTAATEVLGGANSPLYVAYQDGVLAWTEAGGRVVVRLDGRDSTVLQDGGRPTSIAITDGFVYWIDVDSSTVNRASVPR